MPSYNLLRPEDRRQLRQEREAELAAIRGGTWPRDTEDWMRWNPPRSRTPSEHAERCCLTELRWLDHVDATRGGTMDGFIPDPEVEARYAAERGRLLGVLSARPEPP